MTQLTPMLHAKGIYTAINPFIIDSSIIYECISIRTFKDLINQGTDIFASYYAPVGLTEQDYETDLANNANIIALSSTDNVIYIPDTWLASYPQTDVVPYSVVVISASLGPLPDSYDTSFLIEQIGNVLSDVVGITPTVNINIAPSSGVVTYEQSEQLETARQNAIINRTTDYARILTLQNQITLLQEQNQILTNILIANNLLPTN